MSCEHLRSAVGAYALGALDPDEAAAVRRHLETCPECAAEHDALAPLPGLLSLAGGAEKAVTEPLSPAFEERLLDAFARDRAASPRRRLRWRLPRRRWLAAGAVGLAAVAAALVGVQLAGDDQPAPRYDVTFRNVGAPQGTVAKAAAREHRRGHARAALDPRPAAPTRTRSTRCCATPRCGRPPRAPSAPTPRATPT